MDFDLFNPPPEPKSYHNTVGAKDAELAENECKAKTQDQIVYEFFKERPGQKFIADSVWQILIGRGLIHKDTPYTSIRRACSNLSSEKRGSKLIMLDEKTKGFHGSPAHYYILNPNPVEYSIKK